MLSLSTCVELITLIERYSIKMVDRIFLVHDLDHHVHPSIGKFTFEQKNNILLRLLKPSSTSNSAAETLQLGVLQFMINHFYRYEDEPHEPYFGTRDNYDHIPYEDRFAYKNKVLINSLKRDGFVIKGRDIKKMLPQEIEETRTETELFTLLQFFSFYTSKGHLEQAISNHTQGNWAGANSQFRPFIESLLIEISNKLLPSHKCENANSAIKLLGKTVNPPFLRDDLNEVESINCNKPFIDGLWKRLHPQGVHPGLSDEEDSTFRYHISIVVAYYLLKRLEHRN